MAFTISGLFSISVADVFSQTALLDWGTATWNLALFPDSITPDFAVAASATAYDTGVWTAAAELDDPADWPTGGPALVTSSPEGGPSEAPAAGQVRFDATDVSQVTTSITAAEGCLIYMGSIASPVVDQGLVGIDFGAPFTTTNGTFAITWDANGVFYFDVW